jgi:hypothetical protein
MKLKLALTLLAGSVLAGIPRAEAGELNALFDLSLRVGDGGITLGGRVDGPLGPTGATINGRLRPGGIAVDGWIEDQGKGWTFELDANAREGLRAVVRRAPQRI